MPTCGEYIDPETGFQYLRARYYDPATAQFLTRDPIETITRSAYSYVEGNPLNRTDPTGLDWNANSIQADCEGHIIVSCNVAIGPQKAEEIVANMSTIPGSLAVSANLGAICGVIGAALGNLPGALIGGILCGVILKPIITTQFKQWLTNVARSGDIGNIRLGLFLSPFGSFPTGVQFYNTDPPPC